MRLVICFLSVLFFISCNSKKTPDVSDIRINLSSIRFEKELFSLDSAKMNTELPVLLSKYPYFGKNFLSIILNADPSWSTDTTITYVQGFLNAYRPVYDSANKVFEDFSPYEKEIKKGLQLVKYHFPEYKVPDKIITYIGPMDGYGDILSDEAIIIGLHHHIDSNYSLYRQTWVEQVYARYINRRFIPATVSVNAMKNIVLDLYPEAEPDKSLIIQMVEKGKRLYLLQELLPDKEEHLIIGYTAAQLKACYASERRVWDLFVQNELLQQTDQNLIKNYIGESPKTQELGEGAPGNIGSYAGWQIVKKYMSKNPTTTMKVLMKIPAEEIFSEAKYKP